MPGQAMIDPGRLLDALRIEVEVLGEAAHAQHPDTPVPTCPGWTVHEVHRHVGSVYRVVLGWLAYGHRPTEWQREPSAGQPVADYFAEGATELLTELARDEPEAPAASWWPADRTNGFWRRRMAHETTIHRVDVQTADPEITEVTGIADDVALDGIDEVLSLWFGQRLPMIGLSGTREGSVGVRVGEHNWLALAAPGRTVAWRCSAEEIRDVDAMVSGAPMQVYLWLWGRAAPGSVTLSGADEDAAGQLWALLRLATR